MAKGKKTIAVVMPQSEKPMIIKGNAKVATGHRPHFTGTGVHDSRPHRERTRSAKRQSWQREWVLVAV